MKLIKGIVYSNVWIALGSAVYVSHTFFATGSPINYPLLWMVFFATLFSYNFQRLVRFDIIENKTSDRLIWMKRNKKVLQTITVFSFISAATLALFHLSVTEMLLTLPALVLVVFYASFFNQNKKGLRDLPFIKIFIISAVWAYVLGVFPLLLSGNTLNWDLVFIDKFCFILAITIPFDIRDLVFDAKEKKTIPMMFGIKGAKLIAIVALAFSFYLNSWYATNLIVLGCFYGTVLLLILLSNKKKSELYYSGLIDGLLIFSPLLFL